MGREREAHPGSRPMNSGTHGSDWRRHHFGHFAVRQSFNGEQDQCFAVTWMQVVKCRLQDGSLLPRIEPLIGHFELVERHRHRQACPCTLGAFAVAQVASHHVVCDSVQPRAHLAHLWVELRKIYIRGPKHFARQVVGLTPAKSTRQVPVDGTEVTVEDKTEVLGVQWRLIANRVVNMFHIQMLSDLAVWVLE